MASDAPVLAAFMRRRVGRWCESEGVTAGDLTVEISGPAMPVVTLEDGTEVDVSSMRLVTATGRSALVWHITEAGLAYLEGCAK